MCYHGGGNGGSGRGVSHLDLEPRRAAICTRGARHFGHEKRHGALVVHGRVGDPGDRGAGGHGGRLRATTAAAADVAAQVQVTKICRVPVQPPMHDMLESVLIRTGWRILVTGEL
jgi:hypothetical protein